MFGGRLKELLKKYGKVGLGVHFSVSAASITGLYVAIKNNVDVESMLEKVGMPSLAKPNEQEFPSQNPELISDDPIRDPPKIRNRTAELVASTGGALTLAVLLNKALFPVRVPITIALTPPIARFLARRNIIKNSV
ncbi:PREDICTED: uncharacterized protein LOC109161883 [Ipomoea nil]|uniref:uncharacterized protein LOC109161883 n=1 Tax=Ipomoea nil TaxID=35883 RepID=UPI000900FADA|nr:PREDICTED: uncharacterized protein LOC109161883 [Ipomoea nil]